VAEIEVAYTDPFEESTPKRSQTWYDLRALYLSFKVNLEVGREEVSIANIQRNPKDGGKWRWDTPLFDKEVSELTSSIRSTNKFEAVWLEKQDGIYSVLDGHHRVVAWQRMGNSTIPAVVVTVAPRKSVFQFK
jgi:ParB-like chromosome segregation protein Spo0J